MDSADAGSADELLPGVLDRAGDGDGSVSEHVDCTAGCWHSVGSLFFTSWVHGVATTYWKSSIAKV